MKKVRKLVALAIGAIMSASLIAGCSENELALLNAFKKTQTITSMEAKTELTLKVSGINLSADEQEAMQQVMPVLNNSKLSFVTKAVQNADKTSAKMSSDITVQTSMMSVDTSVWVDSNLTGSNPTVKEVFKIPTILQGSLPTELRGKQYFVIDSSTMNNLNGLSQLNYADIANYSKNFQVKLASFVEKYVAQYNPNLDIVTKLGKENIVQPTGTVTADIYQVKLDDATFKKLIRYSVNNLAQNQDARDFVKEYIISTMALSQLSNSELAESKAEIEKGFEEFNTNLPKYLVEVNSCLDKMDNLKILGNNGIVIKYAVNDAGYIINEKGNIEFNVDVPAINKLANDNSNSATGVYTINLGFNSDIYNINGNVSIDMPVLNSSNSIDYADYMKSMISSLDVNSYTVAENLVETAVSTKSFGDYNDAYAAVLELPQSQQTQLLNQLSAISKDVYTEDVVSALNSISKAWANKDKDSLSAAKTAVSNVKNSSSQQWLQAQLNQLETAIK